MPVDETDLGSSAGCQRPVLAISMTTVPGVPGRVVMRMPSTSGLVAPPCLTAFSVRGRRRKGGNGCGVDGGVVDELDGEPVAPAGLLDVEILAEHGEFFAERAPASAVVGEGDAAEVREAEDEVAGGTGVGVDEAVDGVEGVEEEVGVELVAQQFEPGFFLGEPGGVAVALELGEALGHGEGEQQHLEGRAEHEGEGGVAERDRQQPVRDEREGAGEEQAEGEQEEARVADAGAPCDYGTHEHQPVRGGDSRDHEVQPDRGPAPQEPDRADEEDEVKPAEPAGDAIEPGSDGA